MSSLQALLDTQEGRAGSSSGGGARGGSGGWASRGNRWDDNRDKRGGSGWQARSSGSAPSRSGRYGNAGPGGSRFNQKEGSGGGGGSSRWGNIDISPRDHSGSRNRGHKGHEPTYEERRANIERRAVEDSRSAARSRRGDANSREDDIESLLSWVGPLREGRCTYYQDREKRFPFYTDERGYNLLQELMDTNKSLLQLNHQMLEERAATEAANVECDSKDVLIRIGQGLYAHKPTLRTKGVTWSTEEYSHPGLQRMYLRMKSIQRFTEVWCLLERSADLGVFDEVIQNAAPVRVAAVGGGPGYELLATKLFFAQRAPDLELELISMDLCPAWRPYVERLGFQFIQYDINNEEGTDPIRAAGLQPGDLDFCIVSCLMIYCTTDPVINMFRRLVHDDGVNAILVSERGERTKACTMMEERGGEVIRLIDPSGGMDERQAIWCSKAFCEEKLRTTAPDYEGHQKESVFPNVPYCEHKERRGGGKSYGYARHAPRR
ncbi:hypothetical protein ACHAXT_000038 [Thalassiosira profunda]